MRFQNKYGYGKHLTVFIHQLTEINHVTIIIWTDIEKAPLHLQFLPRFLVQFSTSDGCERVDELSLF